MNNFLLFYAIFFFVIQGEPVSFKEEKFYYSYEECILHVSEELDKIKHIIENQPESVASGVCIGKDYKTLGSL